MGNNPSNMKGGRTRDEGGELRRKRDDTLVRSLENEYGVNYTGFRPEQKLRSVRKKLGIDDIKDINKKFEKKG
jgi:hypothetical protein